jgi:hypothetical protein
MRHLAGDALGHGRAFLLRLVREHRPAHHVADRPDVRQVGAAVLVHHHEALVVELETRRGGVQALGVRHPSDGDDELVAVQCFA